MGGPQGAGPSEDAMTLALIVVAVAGLGLVGLAHVAGEVTHWLVAQGVLVPADRAVLRLPDGTGLDLVRLVLSGWLVAVVVIPLLRRLGRRARA